MDGIAGSFMTLIILSLFLIFLAFLVFYLLKKGKVGFGRGEFMKEIDRHYFSPKAFVSIVKIGDEIVMLGITETNINFINKIENKETVDTLLLEFYKGNRGRSFSDFLNVENIDSIKNRIKQMGQKRNEEKS